MLVYLKESMGYTQVGRWRIYGRAFAFGRFGPADIPKNVYNSLKEVIEDAEYTPEWLEAKFSNPFPNITWRVSDLSKIDYSDLVLIANCMGINCKDRKNPTVSDKNAIKRSIISKL